MPLLFESRRMSTMPKKIDPELKAKIARLEEDNAILKAATVFFVGELDPRNR
jgi:transposase-like protein